MSKAILTAMFAFIFAAPEFLESVRSFGNYVGDIWPIFVLLIAAGGGYFKLRKNFNESLKDSIVKTVQSEIEPIKEQFKNNGGSSMKDAIDRIDNKLIENVNQMHVAMDFAQKERLEQLLELNNKMDNLSEAIQYTASRINVITANSDYAYYEIDENAKITYVNDGYLDLFGMTLKQAENNEWANYIHPDDLSRLQRSADSALRNKTDWTCDFRIITKDGVTKAVTARAFPLWEGKDFAGFAGAMVQHT